MKICCTKCSSEYDFKERWFKNNDPSKFVCRKCKIKSTTQSSEFKNSARQKSIAALANDNVRERMSIAASIRAVTNADKISETLKERYKSPEERLKLSKTAKERWADPEYKTKMSKAIKEKWQDPDYRGRVLGSRVRLRKKVNKALKQIPDMEYVAGFSLGTYTFDLLIEGKYLYDEQPSEEKRLFVKHYFDNYVYISDLAEVPRPES